MKHKRTGLSGGNTDTSLPTDQFINFKYPEVGVITKQIIERLIQQKEDVYWLDKTDGERCILCIHGKDAFHINYKVGPKQPNILTKKSDNFVKKELKTTILDTELMDGTYYVFDSPLIDGNNCSFNTYIDRYNKLKEFINKTNFNEKIILKPINKLDEVDSWNILINKLNDIKDNTDGFIIQRNGRYFLQKGTFDYQSYKLKPKCLNTIDCLMKLIGNNEFRLFVSGNKQSLRKYEWRDFNKKQNKDLVVNDKLILPFLVPYYADTSTYVNTKSWDKSGFLPHIIKDIDKMITDIDKDPTKFDNIVVEFSFTLSEELVPVRTRPDKVYPNNIRVAIINMGGHFSPLTSIDKSYFNKIEKTILSKSHHIVSHWCRNEIINSFRKNIKSKTFSAIDLTGGRGGDAKSLINGGCINLFAVDMDRDALLQYCGKVNYLAQNGQKMITLNVIATELTDDNSTFETEITSRYEFPNEGVDVILMNFSIHYLCYSHNVMTELFKTINKLLKPNGIFVITYYDGEEIKKHIKTKNWKINDDYEIKRVTRKLDPEIFDDDAELAIMPLPTIDTSGYREEPLTSSSMLNEIKFKTLINKQIISDGDIDSILNTKDKELHDKMKNTIEYMQLVRMRIYIKNTET
jgi:SAM-dependent methyltransferase